MIRTICSSLSSGALFALTAAVSQAAIIESEPNNTPATADAIAIGAVPYADAGVLTLNAGGVDVFSVDLSLGDVLVANATGLKGLPLGSNPDVVLGIFDSAETLVAFDDDAGLEYGASIGYVIPSTGLYYVAVSGYDGDLSYPTLGDSFATANMFDGGHPESGSYLLALSVTPSVPEPVATLLLIGGLVPALRRVR
ncbi:hypothetical protein Pla123a_07950 [Posidoniimonas polymericola]|uniref:Peptidase C-terminal archaeal/bacterial domain-containing protein n=1 Tax=Posidoniimonas polymericola TaxID=2528002 RepID=A0A5C5ZG11_9BACT|nr:hypothetical protein [Posidoniimonas polymericola]TWT85987.1 hypothetical protein Pla123a_07950 [Posidoniimonas polymericola]